ncbi:hypothetical protein, partial [Leisingera sp. F5]|uniref:hypothetical protein n=1 Tax=Leisingera sp. F5 TaxID=1813816 RepID=UPI0025B8654E
STKSQETPGMSVALRGRRADWNLACGNHQGQWQTATKTGRTDGCADKNAAETTKKCLAMQEPSTEGIQ